MIRKLPTVRAYHDALLEYMQGSGESGLAQAYEFGRSGLHQDAGFLHIIRVHEEALDTIVAATPEISDVRQRLDASAEFLAEALSPFEMAFRGYRAYVRAYACRL